MQTGIFSLFLRHLVLTSISLLSFKQLELILY